MKHRKTRLVAGLLLIALGAACLHYTSAEDAEHHREWAEAHGVPPPQSAITGLGWVSVGAGAAVVLFSLAPSRRSTAG